MVVIDTDPFIEKLNEQMVKQNEKFLQKVI